MKAIQITQNGGPEVLIPAEVADPKPTEGQLLVAVEYAGVNYIDTYYREGIYHSQLPFIPGSEGCGRVIEDPAGEIAPGTLVALSLIHISEPTRRHHVSRMPSSA